MAGQGWTWLGALKAPRSGGNSWANDPTAGTWYAPGHQVPQSKDDTINRGPPAPTFAAPPPPAPAPVGGHAVNTRVMFTQNGRDKHRSTNEVYKVSSKKYVNDKWVYTVHLADYPNATMYYFYEVEHNNLFN